MSKTFVSSRSTYIHTHIHRSSNHALKMPELFTYHAYTAIEEKNSLAVNDVFNFCTVLPVIYSIQQLSN